MYEESSFCVCFSFFFSWSINAQYNDDPFRFSFNSGSFGWGMNISGDGNNHQFTISMLNLYLEHNSTNLGFEFTPITYMADQLVGTDKWNEK